MDNTPNRWTLAELEKWALPALQHPELVEIARAANSAKQAKKQAPEFAKNAELDESEHETLAKACRWLQIMGRPEYGGPEVREKYIAKHTKEYIPLVLEAKMTTNETTAPTFSQMLERAIQDTDDFIQKIPETRAEKDAKSFSLAGWTNKKTRCQKLLRTKFNPETISQFFKKATLLGTNQDFGFDGEMPIGKWTWVIECSDDMEGWFEFTFFPNIYGELSLEVFLVRNWRVRKKLIKMHRVDEVSMFQGDGTLEIESLLITNPEHFISKPLMNRPPLPTARVLLKKCGIHKYTYTRPHGGGGLEFFANVPPGILCECDLRVY